MIHCHETKSKRIDWTQGLKGYHRVWPWPWPWPWIVKNHIWYLLYLSRKWCNCHGTKKQTYALNLRPQMWQLGLTLAMTLAWNVKGQIWNKLYLYQKWSDCHKTNSKHIDWTPCLKCKQWVGSWSWPWPWIFKVKYGISYISTKKGSDCHETKSKHIIQASSVSIGLDLGHDLDLWIFKVNVTLTFDHTHGVHQGFSWSNLEIAVSQNGRADWHWRKGVGVGHPWIWLRSFGDHGQV